MKCRKRQAHWQPACLAYVLLQLLCSTPSHTSASRHARFIELGRPPLASQPHRTQGAARSSGLQPQERVAGQASLLSLARTSKLSRKQRLNSRSLEPGAGGLRSWSDGAGTLSQPGPSEHAVHTGSRNNSIATQWRAPRHQALRHPMRRLAHVPIDIATPVADDAFAIPVIDPANSVQVEVYNATELVNELQTPRAGSVPVITIPYPLPFSTGRRVQLANPDTIIQGDPNSKLTVMPYTEMEIPDNGSLTLLNMRFEALLISAFTPRTKPTRVLMQNCTVVLPLCRNSTGTDLIEQIGDAFNMTVVPDASDKPGPTTFYVEDSHWMLTAFGTHSSPFQGKIALRLRDTAFTCDDALLRELQSVADKAVSNPKGTTTCYTQSDQGRSYRGYASTTISGSTCLPWDADEPLVHWHHPELWPGRDISSNFCRNPTGDQDAPWCYVDNGAIAEKCDIKMCTPEDLARPENMVDLSAPNPLSIIPVPAPQRGSSAPIVIVVLATLLAVLVLCLLAIALFWFRRGLKKRFERPRPSSELGAPDRQWSCASSCDESAVSTIVLSGPLPLSPFALLGGAQGAARSSDAGKSASNASVATARSYPLDAHPPPGRSRYERSYHDAGMAGRGLRAAGHASSRAESGPLVAPMHSLSGRVYMGRGTTRRDALTPQRSRLIRGLLQPPASGNSRSKSRARGSHPEIEPAERDDHGSSASRQDTMQVSGSRIIDADISELLMQASPELRICETYGEGNSKDAITQGFDVLVTHSQASMSFPPLNDDVIEGLHIPDKSDSILHTRISDNCLRSLTHMSTCSALSLGHDDLQILRILGRGSFGQVYLGLWGVKHKVAVKVVEYNPGQQDTAQVDPRIEASLTRELRHPNIVITYDFFWHDLSDNRPILPIQTNSPALVIIMEYCERGSLESNIHRTKLFRNEKNKMQWDVIVNVLLDVAWGLVHLHEAGIIHGDVKAGNVMLKGEFSRNRFTAKLADLGLASLKTSDASLQHSTASNRIVGTLSHAAPEILESRRTSCEGDVYAFGILLYELVTAKRPSDVLTPAAAAEICLSGLDVSSLLVLKRKDDMPAMLVEIYKQCVARHPESRPTMRAVWYQLRRVMEQMSGADSTTWSSSRGVSVNNLPSPHQTNVQTARSSRMPSATDGGELNQGLSDSLNTPQSLLVEAYTLHTHSQSVQGGNHSSRAGVDSWVAQTQSQMVTRRSTTSTYSYPSYHAMSMDPVESGHSQDFLTLPGPPQAWGALYPITGLMDSTDLDPGFSGGAVGMTDGVAPQAGERRHGFAVGEVVRLLNASSSSSSDGHRATLYPNSGSFSLALGDSSNFDRLIAAEQSSEDATAENVSPRAAQNADTSAPHSGAASAALDTTVEPRSFHDPGSARLSHESAPPGSVEDFSDAEESPMQARLAHFQRQVQAGLEEQSFFIRRKAAPAFVVRQLQDSTPEMLHSQQVTLTPRGERNPAGAAASTSPSSPLGVGSAPPPWQRVSPEGSMHRRSPYFKFPATGEAHASALHADRRSYFEGWEASQDRAAPEGANVRTPGHTGMNERSTDAVSSANAPSSSLSAPSLERWGGAAASIPAVSRPAHAGALSPDDSQPPQGAAPRGRASPRLRTPRPASAEGPRRRGSGFRRYPRRAKSARRSCAATFEATCRPAELEWSQSPADASDATNACSLHMSTEPFSAPPGVLQAGAQSCPASLQETSATRVACGHGNKWPSRLVCNLQGVPIMDSVEDHDVDPEAMLQYKTQRAIQAWHAWVETQR